MAKWVGKFVTSKDFRSLMLHDNGKSSGTVGKEKL
jgi:hypothetical protein